MILALAAGSALLLSVRAAAVVLAVLIWLVRNAMLPIRRGDGHEMWLITVAGSIAPVPVHWAVFLFALRKRRLKE